MKQWHIFISLPLLGLLFWIFQGAVVHTLFMPDQPAIMIITGAGADEVFSRGFTLGLFLSFGLAAMLIIQRLSRAESTTRRLNRFLRAVRDIGQIITRETDPHRLITTACESLTATHGFTTAWIVLFDADGDGDVRDAAGTISDEHLEKLVAVFRNGNTPGCAEMQDCDSDVQIVRSIREHCGACPDGEQDSRAPVMSMRLEYGGILYGVMAVSVSPGIDAGGEEVSLFREVGNDFAHALHAIELEHQRATAADALLEAKERYRTLFDSAADAIFIHDTGGHILEVNSAACERLEWGYGELGGMTLADIENPAFRERRISFIERIHQDGHTMYKTEQVSRSGRLIPVEVSSRLTEYRGGHAILSIARDITERKRHEEEMTLYQNAVEAAGEMIVAVDRHYRYILANSAYLTIMGFERDEFIGKTVRDVTGDKRFETVLKPLIDRCFAGEIVELEVSREHPERGLREGIASFYPLNAGNEIVGGVATIRDVTEQKRMNDALRESESRYRTLFENMLNGFVHLEVETGKSGKPSDLLVLDVNNAFARIVDISKETMLGRRATELFPGIADAEFDWIGELGHVALGGEIISHETFVRSTGKWVVFSAFSPIAGYVAALFEDVTDRRLAEQNLARERHLQQALMDNIPADVFFKDRNSRFIMINRHMQEHFKLDDPADAADKTDGDFYTPEISAHKFENEQRVIETGVPMIDQEEHITWLDGTENWFSTTTVPLRDSQGEINGIVGISLDITERNILESQLRQASKMETVARLAGGVAHDFNNMLTAIMGYCNILMLELPAGSAGYDDVQEILNTSQRAADLTRQLLAFSRRQIIKPQVVNLNDVLTNLDRMLRRLIGENIRMVLHMKHDLWPVRVDPGQIEQVLTNLAVNARDAMPAGGRITIETSNAVLDEYYARVHPDVQPGPHVLLSVTDTGEGMDTDTIGRIFEPFFTTKGMGTGLGLSTCYGIVKQNKGNIWVYSEQGRGTSFKIYLPRAAGVAESSLDIEEERPLPTGTERILLAEDERAVRDSAERILTGLGYHVTVAEDGQHALELSESVEINLLITDVVMPRMGGRELADALLTRDPALRVLYMSGYTDNAIVNHGVLEKGIDFIQKPFMAADLSRKVREVLDGDGGGE